MPMNRAMRIATALAVAGFVLGGCERKPEAPAIAGKLAGRNLLLITLDTTRADRLGCYGYKPAETPTLDSLPPAEEPLYAPGDSHGGSVGGGRRPAVPIGLVAFVAGSSGLHPLRHRSEPCP